MAVVPNADNVLSELDVCLGVWQAHQEIKLGNTGEKPVAFADVQALHASLDASNKAVAQKEQELTGLRNKRDGDASAGNDVVTRFRSVVKGLLGPDSTEYEQVGGTRRSEIKRGRRKATTTDK